MRLTPAVPAAVTHHQITVPPGHRAAVYAWTKSGKTPLRLEITAGEKTRAADDGGNGRRSAFVGVALAGSTRLKLSVAASSLATETTFRLHIRSVVEPHSIMRSSSRAWERLSEIDAWIEDADYVHAGRAVSSVVDDLLAVPGARRSPATINAIRAATQRCNALGLLALERRCLEVALRYREFCWPDDYPTLQARRGDLAITLGRLGEVHEARRLTRTVFDSLSRTQPADDALLQKAKLNYAVHFKVIGDYRRAKELELDALRHLQEDNPDYWILLGNLAGTLAALDDREAAHELATRVYEQCMRTLPEDDSRVAYARAGLSSILVELGDLERAQKLEEVVLKTRLRRLPAGHPHVLQAMESLADTVSRSGDRVRALALETKLVRLSAEGLPPDHPDLGRRRAALCASLIQDGDRDALIPVLHSLRDGLRRRFDVTRTLATPRQIASIAHQSRGEIGMLLSSTQPLGDEWSALCVETVESMRSVWMRSMRQSKLARATDPEKRRQLRTLRNEAVAAASRLAKAIDTSAERFQAAVRARRDVEERITAALADLGASREPPTIRRLMAELDADTAAISYWRYDRSRLAQDGSWTHVPSYVAFTITKRDVQRIELGPSSRIDAAIANWRNRVLTSGREDPHAVRESGAALRRLVLDPILAVTGTPARIFVVPDDGIHLATLDALPFQDGFVGGSTRILTVPSLWQLAARSDSGLSQPGELLAVGDVDFDDPTGPDDTKGEHATRFRALPATRSEAAAIERIFSSVRPDTAPRVLRRTHATKARFLRLAPSADFLHLATHGFFARHSSDARTGRSTVVGGVRLRREDRFEDSVLALSPYSLCGLALAGANRGPAGRLTGEEIAWLDLSRCTLAVLSGCDTHVGIRRNGQGIHSLLSAFHAAGARAVVASLWKVDDRWARVFMTEFYRRAIRPGASMARALWRAKEALHRQRVPIRAWAGWILSETPAGG